MNYNPKNLARRSERINLAGAAYIFSFDKIDLKNSIRLNLCVDCLPTQTMSFSDIIEWDD